VEESQSVASLTASSCLDTLRCQKIGFRYFLGDTRGSMDVKSIMGFKGCNPMDEESVNTYILGDNQL
jgi:hypothetical protein